MTDVLIRNVSAEELSVIDAKAARRGLSRSEYLRRLLKEDAKPNGESLTVDDLKEFADLIQDVNDPEAMRKAWE